MLLLSRHIQDRSRAIKLTDFGLSKMVVVGQRRVESLLQEDSARQPQQGAAADDTSISLGLGDKGNYVVPIQDKKFRLSGETGSYKYMAPEVFRHEPYSMKVDVYSFAMVIYEIFEGFLNLKDPAAFAKKAAGGLAERPDCHNLDALGLKRSERMANLIKKCWCVWRFVRLVA